MRLTVTTLEQRRLTRKLIEVRLHRLVQQDAHAFELVRFVSRAVATALTHWRREDCAQNCAKTTPKSDHRRPTLAIEI